MTTQPSQQPSQQDGEPLDRQALRAYVQGLDGDQVNDLLQQSATPADAQAVLNAATRAQIQHVADLNYVDDQRTRTAIARDLLSARFPVRHDTTGQGPSEFAHGAYPTPRAALPEDLTRLPDHLTGRTDQGDQGGAAEQADEGAMVDLTWTERTLQQDGTWHTRAVTAQAPAADIHTWSDQDDDQASGYDATHEAWLEAIGLEDEL